MSAIHPGFGLPRNEISSPNGEARYPFMRWPVLQERIQWKPGQHVLCVGGTDSGKTTLMAIMLRKQSPVAILVSKGADPTLTGPLFNGYVHYNRWPPKRKDKRVMIWPKNQKTVRETRAAKKELFAEVLNDVLLHRGHWCLALDEVHYLDNLGLDPEMEDIEEQGRSFGISVWGNTQRPADIPLAFYVNALHGFFFSTQEAYDLKRLGRIRNKFTNPNQLMWNLERLDHHEFVYIDRLGKLPPVRSVVER